MSAPLISIIVPSYNSEQFIAQTIHSILNQTYKKFELIIINDGSTDKSKAIIETIVDDRIKYVENKTNQGIVYSRNLGLTLANGKYIAMVDADDVVKPQKFADQVAFLEENKEYGMVGCWVKFIDENGQKLTGKWKLDAPPEKIPPIMLFYNYFVQSAVIARLEYISIFRYDKNFPTAQDYMMWVNVVNKCKVWNLPKYLVDYRVHLGGITERHKEKRSFKEREIFKIQLQNLGINPSEEELDLHMLLKDDRSVTSLNKLKSLEQWLIKIVKQNEILKVYNHDMLIRVVFNRWLKVCYKVKISKLIMLFTLFTSELMYSFVKTYSVSKLLTFND
jgi:glycosyltransferase involved in cell wall biosynthesis